MSLQSTHDVRVVLVRDKYFSLRPKPLERWLWKQSVAPSAERVFWLHWEAGHRAGSWCSEIPLRRVAAECCIDVSTVTRAYQQLITLGLVRRQDPGRDPANPFQQATAITEVRLPRELVAELNRYPDRSRKREETSRAVGGHTDSTRSADVATTAESQSTPTDPHRGMKMRDRLRALAILELKMSPGELSRFREAMRTRQPHIEFDDPSALSAENRGQTLQWLECLAHKPSTSERHLDSLGTHQSANTSGDAAARKLSVFDLARLRRTIIKTATDGSCDQILREIVWSIEQGTLRRFDALHAANIALKKLREGAWTRPHRMPPNWLLPQTCVAVSESCGAA